MKCFSYKEFDKSELECLYRNCRHRMKEHDGKICKCRHFTADIDMGMTPKYIMIWDKDDK